MRASPNSLVGLEGDQLSASGEQLSGQGLSLLKYLCYYGQWGWVWGVCVSTNSVASRVTIFMKQEGKSSSTRFSTKCQFRILGFDPRQLILGIFKYSTNLEWSFLVTIIPVSLAQYRQLKGRLHQNSFPSTHDFFHKEGVYRWTICSILRDEGKIWCGLSPTLISQRTPSYQPPLSR